MIFVFVAVCDNENIQSLMIHRRRCQILLQRFCVAACCHGYPAVEICVDGWISINHLMIFVRDVGDNTMKVWMTLAL